MQQNEQRQDLLIAFLILLASIALYGWSMPRTITLIDAGLFQMVCDANGLAHPSGFPIATLICHGLSKLPFEGAVSGNLISAIFGALSCVMLYFLALQLHLSRVYAASAAALLACSTHFWSQAIVIEVYTLNSFLFLCAFYFALRYHQSTLNRDLYACSFFVGTGLANHWPLVVISMPALAAILIHSTASLRYILQPRRVAFSIFFIILGLSPYLLLFTKNSNDMLIHGPIETLQQFIHYIARTSYQDTFLDQTQRSLSYLWWLPLESIKTFGYAAWILLPLGLAHSFKQLDRNQAIALVLLWSASCWLLPLLTHYPYSFEMRSIVVTWTLLAHISCAVWIVLGMKYLVEKTGSKTWSRYAICVGTVAFTLFASTSFNYRAQDQFVDHYGRTLLGSLEANAILFVRADNQTGPLGYLHHIEKVRPDIDIYNLDSILFSNRLTAVDTPPEFKSQAVLNFIHSTQRPVYSIDPLPLPAEDYGLYFKYNVEVDKFNRTELVDSYFAEVMATQRQNKMPDPWTRVLIDSLIYDYARMIIGIGIIGINHSPEFLSLLKRTTDTLQGKIWTLHHALAVEAPNKGALLPLALAAELQLNDEVRLPARAKLYRHIAEVWALAPADDAQSLRYYLMAKQLEDPKLCSSAITRLSPPGLKTMGCTE